MLLEEFLKPLGLTQTESALRLGVSFPRMNEIIRGKRGVSPDTALRLERVLGMPAEFWLGLQQDWDLWHAMRSKTSAEIEKLHPVRRTRRRASRRGTAVTPRLPRYRSGAARGPGPGAARRS